MKIVIQVAIILTATCCVVSLRSELDDAWLQFKLKFAKEYSNDELFRRQQWELNKAMIDAHNEQAMEGKFSYFMAQNHFSDLSTEELAAMHLSSELTHDKEETPSPTTLQHLQLKKLSSIQAGQVPRKVDYRSSPCLPPAKDQQSCGACWAFAAVTPLEFRSCMLTRVPITLSEQQLIDCSPSSAKGGCMGGYYKKAWKYIQQVGGIQSDTVYPYNGKANNSCVFDKSNISVTVSSSLSLPVGNETAMRNAVYLTGPIATTLDARLDSFMFYSKGIYDDLNCGSNQTHAVVLVGYAFDQDTGVKYWILRNSWGSNWGMDGYMYIKRGTNKCGLARRPAYPVI